MLLEGIQKTFLWICIRWWDPLNFYLEASRRIFGIPILAKQVDFLIGFRKGPAAGDDPPEDLQVLKRT